MTVTGTALLPAPPHAPLLAQFSVVGLDGLQGAELQRRYDVKTLATEAEAELLLEALIPRYHVLEVDGYRAMDYRTQYLDTERFDFYRDHHNRRLGRHKVRYRTYVQSRTSFFEVKHKSNKGLGEKRRVSVGAWGAAAAPEELELLESCGLAGIRLRPTLSVEYVRTTLVSKTLDERVTVDHGLSIRSGTDHRSWPRSVIIEVKQPRLDRSSHAFAVLRRLGRRPVSVSKYCVGVASCSTELKRNRFRRVLRRLEELS